MPAYTKDNINYIDTKEKDYLICKGPKDKSVVNFVLDKNTRLIDKSAFKKCNIDSIIIPENLDYIDTFAFEKANITELLFSKKVTIKDFAFHEAVINNIFLNIKEIPKNCFLCATIKNIKLKNTVSIDSSAFEYAKIGSIEFPDTLTCISSSAFSNACFEKNILSLPESIKEIREDAFSGVKGIDRIILPNNLTYLSPNFLKAESCTKHIKIICNEETVKRFPFLESLNIEITSIDYLLKTNKSFKEINAAFNKTQER